jgi:hypothetical protein
MVGDCGMYQPTQKGEDVLTGQTTWNFVILGNFYDIKKGEFRADADALLSAQEFWFAIFITVL